MLRIRFRNLVLLGILPAILIGVPAGESWGVSVRASGDFEFYLDIASLPTADRGTLELLQIAIPTKEIRYVASNGTYVAEVRLSIHLKSGDREVIRRVYRKKDPRDTQPRERDLSAFLYVLDSCYVDPGRYELTVKVEDLKRREKTLLGLLRRHHMSAEVKGAVIDVPAIPSDRLMLGDPVLVWSGTSLSSFVPNPMQIYGLRKDTLTVLVDALLPETASADSLAFRVALSKETGEIMGEDLFNVSVRGRRSTFFKRVDLTTYPAGAYHLLVEADDGKNLYAQAGTDFSVAWELLNWQKPVRDILMEAEILLSDKDYRQFEKMSLGEQESFMKGFWKKLDPTPQTAINEKYEAFKERVRYADAHFGGYTRGALSDRGFMYIRFGPPDEIVRKPVPVNRDDLSEALALIEDQYKIMIEGFETERPRMVDRRPSIPTAVQSRSTYGRGTADAGGFEIWSYNFKGDPILDADKAMTIRSGMRLLFVDRDGYGDYRLTGSSEEMMKQEGK